MLETLTPIPSLSPGDFIIHLNNEMTRTRIPIPSPVLFLVLILVVIVVVVLALVQDSVRLQESASQSPGFCHKVLVPVLVHPPCQPVIQPVISLVISLVEVMYTSCRIHILC